MTHPNTSSSAMLTTDSVRFSVERLAAWAPGLPDEEAWRAWARGEREIAAEGEPALTQMAGMLRRHAGRFGRIALDPAYRALGDSADVPVVFASRYGDMARTAELLTALADGKGMSPTAFGLSVHNAIPGLWAMARQDRANSIALAAGEASAAHGVIEASALLADGAARVLLVVADCPLPLLFENFERPGAAAVGWACLLTRPGEDAVTLEWRSGSAEPAASGALPPMLAPLPVLLGEASQARHCTGGRRWSWLRDA